MSEDKRGGAPEVTDLAEAPFLDEQERAESAWLIARENDPGAPAPSPEIARHYAELEDLLGAMPPGLSGEPQRDGVSRPAAGPTSSAEAPARPRRRRRVYPWALGAAVVAAAAVAVLVLRPAPRPDVGELEIAIAHRDQSRSDAREAREAAVGDRLIIRARPRGTADLRVYRADGPLVARCPAGPGCTTPAPGEHAIEIRLDAPVQYHVILVVGADNLPAGTMNVYLDAARAANARIVTYPPIEVH